ncbi:MAG: integrase [Planctomycetaceae bacterium]|nr:integrase [Planctomycetaceae bacterium]
MASISRDPNGFRRILFMAPDGKRRTIRLGKVPQHAAQAIKARVEQLVGAKMTGHAVEADTARWVAKLEPAMADKLAAVGLIPKREAIATVTLEAFLSEYIRSRESKPLTVVNLRRAADLLTEHFGEGLPLTEITPGLATGWRDWLRTAKPTGKGMGVNTARRHIGRARQFCAAAVRRKLIPANPFAELVSSLVANRSRDRFITHDEAQAVLDACPNAEWRLLFALARFGGLRIPSEAFGLRWQDIDWERNRITVNSPKTEHHAGKDCRVIPIFPELRPHLEAAFDAAPDGAVCCISGIGSANPGTHMKRIIRKAGLTPWGKLFHNLRASRETELTETYPIQTVVAWLGNSPAVALRHYLQVPVEHFERAAGQAAQIPAQQPAESPRMSSQSTRPDNASTLVLQGYAGECESVQEANYPRQDSNLRPTD